jgi:hypothetical protein
LEEQQPAAVLVFPLTQEAEILLVHHGQKIKPIPRPITFLKHEKAQAGLVKIGKELVVVRGRGADPFSGAYRSPGFAMGIENQPFESP